MSLAQLSPSLLMFRFKRLKLNINSLNIICYIRSVKQDWQFGKEVVRDIKLIWSNPKLVCAQFSHYFLFSKWLITLWSQEWQAGICLVLFIWVLCTKGEYWKYIIYLYQKLFEQTIRQTLSSIQLVSQLLAQGWARIFE